MKRTINVIRMLKEIKDFTSVKLLKGNNQSMKEVILETKKVIAEITRSMKDWKKIKEITQKVEQGQKRWTI